MSDPAVGRRPGEMAQEIIARLQDSTGRSLADWVLAVQQSNASSRQQRVEWLMRESGLGRVAANVIASHAEGNATDYADQEGLLNAMYAGPKAPLRAIYDKLIGFAETLGPEFGLYQCAGQTTLKRERQFAWIKPSTRTRVDLGLALPGVQPHGRLLPVSGTNDKDRVRLRIALSSIADIDAEVESWLTKAWNFEAQTRK